MFIKSQTRPLHANEKNQTTRQGSSLLPPRRVEVARTCLARYDEVSLPDKPGRRRRRRENRKVLPMVASARLKRGKRTSSPSAMPLPHAVLRAPPLRSARVFPLLPSGDYTAAFTAPLCQGFMSCTSVQGAKAARLCPTPIATLESV